MAASRRSTRAPTKSSCYDPSVWGRPGLCLSRPRCPLCAKSGHSALRHTLALFDHLVGAGEQRRRHFDADGFRRLQIDDEFKLGRLKNWKVGGLGAFEDAARIDTSSAARLRPHLARGIARRDPVGHRQRGKLHGTAGKEAIALDEEGISFPTKPWLRSEARINEQPS